MRRGNRRGHPAAVRVKQGVEQLPGLVGDDRVLAQLADLGRKRSPTRRRSTHCLLEDSGHSIISRELPLASCLSLPRPPHPHPNRKQSPPHSASRGAVLLGDPCQGPPVPVQLGSRRDIAGHQS